MVQRKEYLDKLISWKDEQVIKVVTGIRRCGKSTLLAMYQDYLRQNGVDDEHIIYLNFEDLENEHLLDYKALYTYIIQKLPADGKTYIFLDEIQKVAEFEKTVDSLYIKPNTDVYITGSNAYLLSSDLATLLSGRYVEISMLPFSFREYCEITGATDFERAFVEYNNNGGFPYVAPMKTQEKIDTYLDGIYNTVIIKDIEERQNRKNSTDKRNVTDITLLKSIARFLASTIGSPISIKSITDYIVSTGRKISPNTISDYLNALEESFIFYHADRFDVVGKQLLKTNAKYYMVDLGLRNHILPRANYDLGFSLENIVYFELLRRGYSVNVGKVGTAEVDFVAHKQSQLTYIQVTASMLDSTTFEREMKPLKAIKDNYKKVILTLDKFTVGNYDGIQVINAIDWLLNK